MFSESGLLENLNIFYLNSGTFSVMTDFLALDCTEPGSIMFCFSCYRIPYLTLLDRHPVTGLNWQVTGCPESQKTGNLCAKMIIYFLYLHTLLSLWTTILSDGEGNGTPLQYSCLENPMDGGAWWAAAHGVAKGWTWLSDFTFTFHFHTLEKEMATHSSVLAWRIPGTRELGGLLSMGSHRVGHDWSDLAVSCQKLHLDANCIRQMCVLSCWVMSESLWPSGL